ncbi:class I SAM-dependent methyltransferase [Microbacterium terricola]|uniref:SAM-dependent methyltransferase n=1 Tax=Microbacterium terricola TaxID=344163 RepID=A0ABM8E2V7_9MICO|nr:class I SAM-dependent methyltransferase [Microbacterium terricola]UYK40160.1 class I SAM-dependent methyltransferase [Microbacterium terricola]BDV32135.1 SAM-dependent methyltransferase [Microbacterium terricola]
MHDADGEDAGEQVAAFADDIFSRFLGGMESLSIYVGDRLGLYRALVDAPATVAALAERTGLDERYAREWLEQQAVAGILTVDSTAGDPRFVLPAAHAEVLADPGSLAFSAPLARMLVAAATRMPELLSAYRAGGGVGWAAYGADARDAQGDINRPWFESALAGALASVPAVHQVLSRPGARIADVGCGHGWSTIALARAYPDATVAGFDVDEPSIAAARTHAAEAGVGSASFQLRRGEQLDADGAGRYDAAFVFEALHDLPDPVAVLTALHRAVRPDGVVVIMDEAVADAFAPDGDDVERVMYTYSLLICLPDSLSTEGSVGTGTVMRTETLERYAREAGFTGVTVLPIEGFAAFRFSLLER